MKLLTLTSCLLIACPVFITDAFSPKAFFKDTSFSLGNARARPNYPLATNNNGLNMTPSGDEEPTLDRRGWIKKVVAGGSCHWSSCQQNCYSGTRTISTSYRLTERKSYSHYRRKYRFRTRISKALGERRCNCCSY